MRNTWLAICLAIAPVFAHANPVAEHLPDAQLRGEATLRFLGMSFYSARLFTTDGAPLKWTDDFALELTYRQKFSQEKLVEATLREMQRLGAGLPPRSALETCFKSVRPGDKYLAISDGPDRVVFWRNDKITCRLSHPDIKSGFMGIFLGDKTRSRRFTTALLGR